MQPIDICYTPLDIPIRPNINISKFISWVKDVYPQPCKETAIHAEKSFGLEYTWDLVFGATDGVWQNDFDKKFPELATYCYEAFKIQRYELNTVVFLPVRPSVNGIGFWHNDVDLTGFRFYLECENHEKNPLLLRKTKFPYKELQGIVVPISGDDDRLQEEIITCNMSAPHMAYYLNNFRSVHAPMIHTPGIRIAAFVTVKKMFTEIVQNRTKDLIVSSALKYKDHAILW
jgi:hypothetical protein